jgi:hypothetical protein
MFKRRDLTVSAAVGAAMNIQGRRMKSAEPGGVDNQAVSAVERHTK